MKSAAAPARVTVTLTRPDDTRHANGNSNRHANTPDTPDPGPGTARLSDRSARNPRRVTNTGAVPHHPTKGGS